ncbi:hypothetical protein B0H11DRAFT_2228488 [Mycena galericulata]|nr:hypothetical protein B0H11DRAFT_2228488 [Mycena galericulata]
MNPVPPLASGELSEDGAGAVEDVWGHKGAFHSPLVKRYRTSNVGVGVAPASSGTAVLLERGMLHVACTSRECSRSAQPTFRFFGLALPLSDALLFDASTHPRECASILLNDTEFKRKRPSHQRPHVLSEYLPLRRESYDMSHDTCFDHPLSASKHLLATFDANATRTGLVECRERGSRPRTAAAT